MLALILVVEDNATEQYVLRQLLCRFEYDCDTVASGEEALQAMSVTNYAAVLMDVGLPGMDGLQCTREIRKIEKQASEQRRTPVIGLTARIQKKDELQCFEAGMDDYICKPFDPENLRRVLLRWVYQPDKPNLKLLSPTTVEKDEEGIS